MPTPPSPPSICRSAPARLLRPGELGRLRVGRRRHRLARAPRSADWEEQRNILLPPGEGGGELAIGQYENGDYGWAMTCAAWSSIERSAPGPMARIPRYLLDDPFFCAKGLAGAIRHYAQYVIPIRVYRSGGFSLPTEVLSLRLIDKKHKR